MKLMLIAAIFAAGYLIGTRRAERPAGARSIASSSQGNPEPGPGPSGAPPASRQPASPAAPFDPRARTPKTGDEADQVLAAFVRSAYTGMIAAFAQNSAWPTSAAQIPVSRPANVDLELTEVSNDGFRLSAVDHTRRRECDLFMGDSARMAFGYAYDQGKPACGSARRD